MTDLLGTFAIVIGGILSLTAFFAVLNLFFPTWVARTQVGIETRPGRSFVIGLVNLLFFGTLALAFFAWRDESGADILGLPGLLLLGLLLIALSFGLAAVMRIASERLTATPNGVSRGLRQQWLATTLVAFACLLPIAGWFLLFPYLALTGIGGFVMVLLQARRGKKTEIGD